MKKKILVTFTGPIDIGGIERSLISLLDAIDYSRYDVDLFLYSHHGVLYNQINPNVNILKEVKELAYLRESFTEKIRHGCYRSAVYRIRDEIKSKFIKVNNDETWAEIMRKYAPKLKKHYDIALGFFLPFDFLKENVIADVKVGWIHTDYSSEKIDYNRLYKEYCDMDYIVAISEQCKESFIKVFTILNEKVIVIENILSDKFIIQQAHVTIQDEILFEGDSIKIVTLGRFTYAKKMDDIPIICRKIREQGVNVKWYLIGFGNDEKLIRKRIEENEMEGYVIVIGKKENPYPYINKCDIYAQPSRYEGKSVAVREAQILHKPVIITNYTTAPSQVEDGIDGIIVPMEIEGCSSKIASIIKDKKLLKQLEKNTIYRDYTNKKEVEKIYQIIRR